jgi:hypothetical protein
VLVYVIRLHHESRDQDLKLEGTSGFVSFMLEKAVDDANAAQEGIARDG